jgi:hypothetical protein
MKNKSTIILIITLVFFSTITHSQTNKNTEGLNIEFGDGGTLVGTTIKYSFDLDNSLQVELLFGQGSTSMSTFYHHSSKIANAKSLNYYIGKGSAVGFGDGYTLFFLRPTTDSKSRL